MIGVMFDGLDEIELTEIIEETSQVSVVFEEFCVSWVAFEELRPAFVEGHVESPLGW